MKTLKVIILKKQKVWFSTVCTGCGKLLFTCAKQICGNCGKLLIISKYQHFACGKVCGKLVDNFFLLFSIFFFHILEYHNGGLCGQGSDEVECRHHME